MPLHVTFIDHHSLRLFATVPTLPSTYGLETALAQQWDTHTTANWGGGAEKRQRQCVQVGR